MSPDILIIDFMLNSELNGLDVARLLAKDLPDMNAIVITGDIELELPRADAVTGKVSLLRKPFGLKALRVAMDEAAPSSQKRA